MPKFEISTASAEERRHDVALGVLQGYWFHLGYKQEDFLRTMEPNLAFRGHLTGDRKMINSLAKHDLVEKVAPEEASPRLQKWQLSPLGAEVHKHLVGKCTYRKGDYAC